MKIRHKLVISALLLITAGFVEKVYSGNSTQISFECAPWDGSALAIEIGAPDLVIRASIWGRGFERLSKGVTTILIDNTLSSQGTGRGSLWPTRGLKRNCQNDAKIRFDFTKVELKPGGRISGHVSWGKAGMNIPFDGVIDPKRAICG